MSATDNRDLKAEAKFRKRRVEFTYVRNVSPSNIDMEASKRNQARLGEPLDATTVTRYATKMEEGAVFPPVWLTKQPNGTYLNIDGNHRAAAAIESGHVLDAYELTGPEQALILLTMEANADHGRASSEEDRLHHALYWVENGVTPADAAEMFGVKRAILDKSLTGINANRRADEAGILRRTWDRIPQYIRNRVAAVRTDEGFSDAAVLVADAGLNIDVVNKLVTEVNKERSARRQCAIIAAWRADLEDVIAARAIGNGVGKQTNRVTHSPAGRLKLAAGQVHSLEGMDFSDLPPLAIQNISREVDNLIKALASVRQRCDEHAAGTVERAS